jgi:GH24 family phage-related lysozyme (muramidase)
MTHVDEWARARQLADVAIRRAESERGYVYDCLGILHYGIGHKLLPGELATMKRGDPVEIELVNSAYKFDMEQAYRAVVRVHVRYPAELTAERIAVLIEMAFALGESGLNKFTKMWRMIAHENWQGAADEILDSVWHNVQGAQVPAIAERVERLALQMRVGEVVW